MTTRWKKADSVVWEELGDEALLVEPGKSHTWRLNRAAAFLWKHCDGTISLREIARALSNGVRAEARRIEADLAAFCARLETAGLLRASVAGAGAPQALYFSGLYAPPSLTTRHAGSSRRRPGPRGISGPA